MQNKSVAWRKRRWLLQSRDRRKYVTTATKTHLLWPLPWHRRSRSKAITTYKGKQPGGLHPSTTRWSHFYDDLWPIIYILLRIMSCDVQIPLLGPSDIRTMYHGLRLSADCQWRMNRRCGQAVRFFRTRYFEESSRSWEVKRHIGRDIDHPSQVCSNTPPQRSQQGPLPSHRDLTDSSEQPLYQVAFVVKLHHFWDSHYGEDSFQYLLHVDTGIVIPLVHDPISGFTWVIEYSKAQPTIEARNALIKNIQANEEFAKDLVFMPKLDLSTGINVPKEANHVDNFLQHYANSSLNSGGEKTQTYSLGKAIKWNFF